jgi:hypothetical protein
MRQFDQGLQKLEVVARPKGDASMATNGRMPAESGTYEEYLRLVTEGMTDDEARRRDKVGLAPSAFRRYVADRVAAGMVAAAEVRAWLPDERATQA